MPGLHLFLAVHPDCAVYYSASCDGYFLDDREFRASTLQNIPMLLSEGDSPESVRNNQKYIAQTFLVVNTNTAASTDTNLYNACASFPADTNSAPNLQIARYGTNAVLIKANHFDYSAESERDFALIICDKVETPVWKTVDLSGSSDTQDGWLVQGTVPRWKVADPMFLMVSNVSRTYNAFFRAIPYSGPQVTLAGPQPYDVVSNTITIQATITDLSGVTNQQLQVTVDGYPPRYSIGASNTICIDTRYNNAGLVNIYVTAMNNAQVYDPASPPDKTKLCFSTIQSLPLDFENDTYVAFASDMCSPDVGTNYMLFAVSQAQQIAATITEPTSGRIVASYAGYVPYPANVAIPWDFTEADGVSPYSNDTYAVSFTAFDSTTTLTVTNTVDRVGVRAGAGTFLTYQWEDPHFTNPDGQWLNDQADTWIKGALYTLYNDLYSWYGLTQYQPWMVGSGRNLDQCWPRDAWSGSWFEIISKLTNSYYSELTLGPAHGSGAEIGGGQEWYLPGSFTPFDLKRYVMGVGSKNWRLRKANLWTCYSGDIHLATGGYYNTYWADACGIRPTGLQETTYMRKNAGVFLGGEINIRGFNGDASISTAKVAETCDQIWVCGKYMYPGGCDPTYSLRFAVNATRGMFNPELDYANPLLFGCRYMIYSSVYDDMLMVGNTVFVHEQ